MSDAAGRRRDPNPIRFEPLEPRVLLSADAPVVTDIFADNRGLIEITVDQDLRASTVTQEAVQVFTAGQDGLLGTPDDELRSRSIFYDAERRTIIADAVVPTDERYRVLARGFLIRGENGCLLDGEFNGPGVPSGDGVEGGDLEFFTRSFVGNPMVRITTNLGAIDMEMFADATPLHVANFFNYMNRGDYDDVIFHRSVEDFVVQGGGFENRIGFPNLPSDPPVMNEPGISNLRGTIALAKLGGDPNSGTNQFFFNLGDNSANLDNQNGGFTVFGEIIDDAGLSVMDAMAALETVDASNINGAFGQLPVLSVEDFEDRGDIPTPSNTLVMLRAAEKYEITAEPFRQLPTEGLISFGAPGGGGTVTVFSLEGVPLGQASNFMRVTFSGSSVRSVVIHDNPPSPIGIQITGDRPVDAIRDTRRDADNSIAFIVSDPSVRSMTLRGDLIGTNLNGVLLSGGVLLPDDIDGDGDGSDPTAIIVREGAITSLAVENLNASAVVDGTVGSLSARGEVVNARMVFGRTSEVSQSKLRFQSVRNSTLDTATPITSLEAWEWLTNGTEITAPRIDRLAITGRGGSDGEFRADLSLVGDGDDATRELGQASIRGFVLGSDWDINGGAGPINLSYGAKEWDLIVRGDGASVRSGFLDAAALRFEGNVVSVISSEWEGGELRADTISTLAITGRGGSGNLNADIILRQVEGVSARSITAAGGIAFADLLFEGEVESFRPRGDLENVSIRGTVFNDLRFRRVEDLDLIITGGARTVSASEWDGGSFTGSNVETISITGAGLEDPVGFRADLRLNGVRTLNVNGDFESSSAELFSLPRFNVTGNVVNSTVTFTQTNFFNPAITSLNVSGFSIDSEYIVDGFGGAMTFGGLEDSVVNVGGPPGTFRFPEDGSGFNAFARMESITVFPSERGVPAMFDSYILGGTLPSVTILDPETFNNGRDFGVAALDLGVVRVRSGVDSFGVPAFAEEPVVLNDFQVRPGFSQPGDES